MLRVARSVRRANVFEYGIAFNTAKKAVREWQELYIGSHVNTGDRKQIDVDIPLRPDACAAPRRSVGGLS